MDLPKTKEEFSYFTLTYSKLSDGFINHCIINHNMSEADVARWYFNTLTYYPELVEVIPLSVSPMSSFRVYFAGVYIGLIDLFNALRAETERFVVNESTKN